MGWSVDILSISEDLKRQILRGDELLRLCHKMKCEQDGIKRPEPLKFHIGLNYDQFAEDVDQALLNHTSLLKMSSLEKGMVKLGSIMRDAKTIEVSSEDDLASAALAHILFLYGLAGYEIGEKIKGQVEKGVELFSLCKKLGENKKVHKAGDRFCEDIDMSIKLHLGLLKKFPLMMGLSALGRKLNNEKLVNIDIGQDISVVTMRYLLFKYGIE